MVDRSHTQCQGDPNPELSRAGAVERSILGEDPFHPKRNRPGTIC